MGRGGIRNALTVGKGSRGRNVSWGSVERGRSW